MDQKLWPSGLRVMVVDNNPSHLSLMEQLLLKCSYEVTTCKHVEEAITFLWGNQQSIDLIISDIFFPTEDGLLMLGEVTSTFKIPILMMSSTGDTSTVMKYISNGASDFLIKPLRIEELKHIWQHVFRKQIGEHRSNTARGEQCYASSAVSSFSGTRNNAANEAITDIRDLKKSRLTWTMQLHRQFIEAVNFLGTGKAVPKRILEIMKVKHLTREQVASHLQKYRLHLRKSRHSMPKDHAPTSSASHADRSSIPRSRNDIAALSSMHFDQNGCIEIMDSSLLRDQDDHLSCGSDCVLWEQNSYSHEEICDLRSWDSDKQTSELCLWNFSV